MFIGDLLDARAVWAKASGGTKRQVLAAAADAGARLFQLDAQMVLDALLEREAAGSTGVGYGVAVPHARIPGLDRPRAMFIRLEAPVAFEALDGQPVDLLFVLLSPEDSGVDHLRALARISRLMRQAELRAQLRLARSPEAILALLGRDDARPSAA